MDRNTAALLRALGQDVSPSLEQSMGLQYDATAEEVEENIAAPVADDELEVSSEEDAPDSARAIALIQRWYRRRKFRRLVEGLQVFVSFWRFWLTMVLLSVHLLWEEEKSAC
jgi:hypothetical protein